MGLELVDVHHFVSLELRQVHGMPDAAVQVGKVRMGHLADIPLLQGQGRKLKQL